MKDETQVTSWIEKEKQKQENNINYTRKIAEQQTEKKQAEIT